MMQVGISLPIWVIYEH